MDKYYYLGYLWSFALKFLLLLLVSFVFFLLLLFGLAHFNLNSHTWNNTNHTDHRLNVYGQPDLKRLHPMTNITAYNYASVCIKVKREKKQNQIDNISYAFAIMYLFRCDSVCWSNWLIFELILTKQHTVWVRDRLFHLWVCCYQIIMCRPFGVGVCVRCSHMK